MLKRYSRQLCAFIIVVTVWRRSTYVCVSSGVHTRLPIECVFDSLSQITASYTLQDPVIVYCFSVWGTLSNIVKRTCLLFYSASFISVLVITM